MLVHNQAEYNGKRVSDDGYAEVTLTYEKGMPRSQFKAKAEALQRLGNEGKLLKAPNPIKRNTNITRKYKSDFIKRIWKQYGSRNRSFAEKATYRAIDKMSPDHVWELQLSGPDDVSNLRMLDRTTNETIGMRQIWPQIRSLPDYTPIRIRIEGL